MRAPAKTNTIEDFCQCPINALLEEEEGPLMIGGRNEKRRKASCFHCLAFFSSSNLDERRRLGPMFQSQLRKIPRSLSRKERSEMFKHSISFRRQSYDYKAQWCITMRLFECSGIILITFLEFSWPVRHTLLLFLACIFSTGFENMASDDSASLGSLAEQFHPCKSILDNCALFVLSLVVIVVVVVVVVAVVVVVVVVVVVFVVVAVVEWVLQCLI